MKFHFKLKKNWNTFFGTPFLEHLFWNTFVLLFYSCLTMTTKGFKDPGKRHQRCVLFSSVSELGWHLGGVCWVSQWWRGSGGVWAWNRWVCLSALAWGLVSYQGPGGTGRKQELPYSTGCLPTLGTSRLVLTSSWIHRMVLDLASLIIATFKFAILSVLIASLFLNY